MRCELRFEDRHGFEHCMIRNANDSSAVYLERPLWPTLSSLYIIEAQESLISSQVKNSTNFLGFRIIHFEGAQ
jgi:hypothetical protein